MIGFLDNNPSKHGTQLRNIPIYSPEEINHLSFDKVIIASCYHDEIESQLVRDFNVPSEKIIVYLSEIKSSNRFWARTQQYASQTYLRWVLSSRYHYIALTGLWIARRVSHTYDTQQLTPIHWLDEDLTNVEVTLQPETEVTIHGPKYTGSNQNKVIINLPEIRLSRYRDATILCSSNAVLQGNKLFMWRSPVSDNLYSDYSVGNVLNHGKTHALTIAYNAQEINKGIAITGSSDINYYHWMLEVLSKLAYLDQIHHRYSNFPILISENARNIDAISTFLDQLKIKRNIVYLRSNQHYKVNFLLTVTPPNFQITNFKGKSRHCVSDCYFTSKSLCFLRDTGLKYLLERTMQVTPHKRIFLARKGEKRPYNQEEVWKLLEANGFKAAYFEDMLLEDQIYTVQNARVIVGPTGAAWTNLLFCAPGTKALCWMAEEAGDFACYSHIASEMDVDLEYLTYKAGSINSRELYYGQYSIDVQHIEKWVEQLATLENSYYWE